MCEIGGWATRNIVLDQTNVSPKARQCKKEQFRNFGIKRAIGFGNNNDTLEQRTHKREAKEGKFIPEEAKCHQAAILQRLHAHGIRRNARARLGSVNSGVQR